MKKMSIVLFSFICTMPTFSAATPDPLEVVAQVENNDLGKDTHPKNPLLRENNNPRLVSPLSKDDSERAEITLYGFCTIS